MKLNDHYNLCSDCFDKNADRYLEEWYAGKSGHFVNAGGRCDVCGKEIKPKKENLTDKVKKWFW